MSDPKIHFSVKTPAGDFDFSVPAEKKKSIDENTPSISKEESVSKKESKDENAPSLSKDESKDENIPSTSSTSSTTKASGAKAGGAKSSQRKPQKSKSAQSKVPSKISQAKNNFAKAAKNSTRAANLPKGADSKYSKEYKVKKTQVPGKVEYESGKYKIIRLSDNPMSNVILTENNIEVKNAFYEGEAIQIFNIDDMELLFVFHNDTQELLRVVDLEYRTIFITKVPFGEWSVMHPSSDGHYIVVMCNADKQKVNSNISSMAVGIWILNTKDLMDKIKHHRLIADQTEIILKDEFQQEKNKVSTTVEISSNDISGLNPLDIKKENFLTDEMKDAILKEIEEKTGKTPTLEDGKKKEKEEIVREDVNNKEEVEEIVKNHNYKAVIIGGKSEDGQEVIEVITSKPEMKKNIRLKVVAKANVFNMKNISSKINMQCDDIVDNLYSEESWVSLDTFEIRHYLNYNKKYNKSMLQLSVRETLDMIKNKDPLEPQLYKTISMKCTEQGVESLTIIEEGTWKRWNDVRQQTLGNQHYISVVQEQFTPYKSFVKMLETKVNKGNHQYYTALMEPIVNIDGTRYSDEISDSIANFEIHFPKLSTSGIIFFQYKDGLVTIEKVISETGEAQQTKTYSTFGLGLSALNKLI